MLPESQMMQIERRRADLNCADVWFDGEEVGEAIRGDYDALLAEVARLGFENFRLRNQVRGHCDRIAAQSALLSKRAEKAAL